MEPSQSVRFPASTEIGQRLSELDSREPVATTYLSLHAASKEVSPMGAVVVLLNTAIVANRIEKLVSDRSDGPMDTWDLMRRLAAALFDGTAQEIVVSAIDNSKDAVERGDVS